MSRTLSNRSNRHVFHFRGPAPDDLLLRLPELHGRPITVTYRPRLTAYKGRLLSESSKGKSVYAGSFLRRRTITLDDCLLRTPRVWERIFAHEVGHFIWSRLPAALRESYTQLVHGEIRQGERGELGWSAESIKLRLLPADPLLGNTRWKNYVCESFCDTAGWVFGSARTYAELTLPAGLRELRRDWCRAHLLQGHFSV